MENKLAVFAALLQPLVAGLCSKRSHVAHRTGVGGYHAQNLPGVHVLQRSPGFQYWQGQEMPEASKASALSAKIEIQAEQAEIARLAFTRDLGRRRQPCHKVLI